MIKRCSWVGDDPLMTAYHDLEWGTPLHDDRKLFELLILEGMQAGLSWKTILNKRAEFRRSFDRFDPAKIARYDSARVKKLMANPGIIRNRLKIESAVGNAQAFLKVKKEIGSFDEFIWGFVGGRPIVNAWKELKDIPIETAESEGMSKALKKRGFRFVGPTICYAFMQAAGMVNDHLTDCFRYKQLRSSGGH